MWKAAGMDGLTAEMLKYGCDAVVEWMLLMCERAWEKREVPDDWQKAIIVPLYKGIKVGGSVIAISLLSVPGKVYERILTEKQMEVTEWKVSEEQGGFRKGRGCVDMIFAMKILVEEYLGKNKSCMELLWIFRRYMIGLTENLSGMC